MAVIRILTRLESETVHLPEIQPLVGRDIEIIVREQTPARAIAAPEKWKEFFARRRGAVVDQKLIDDYREFDAAARTAWCDDPR